MIDEDESAGRPPVRGAVHGSNGAAIGRSLPHSLEAEECLLSCCLLDGAEMVGRCIEAQIRPESFYETKHGIIYEQLLGLAARKEPLDIAVLAAELKTARLLDAVGGYAFLTQVTSLIPTTAQAAYFIERVREFALLREMIRTGTGIVEECYNFTGGIDEFLGQQEARLFPLLNRRSAGSKALTVWGPAEFRAWSPPIELNLLGAGYLRRRQITTLIGPPGVGKSRLSLWLGVCHIANRQLAGLDPKGGNLKWLFIGNENDPERQKNDLAGFYRSLTKSEQTKVDQQLKLHVLDSHEDSQLALMDPDAYRRIANTLKIQKPDVTVWDPWGNMIEGSESDDLIIRQTLKLLLRCVAENAPDAAILIIHHARTGKLNTIEAGNNYSGGNLGRGSKVLVSQARCELALWPGDAQDSSKLVLTCEKVNNAPKFDPIGLVFENGIYSPDPTFSLKGWRDDIEGHRSTKTLTIADVVRCVTDGVVKYQDICARCSDSSVATVKRRLLDAVMKGYLRKTQPAGSYELGSAAIKKTAPRDFTESAYQPGDDPNDR